MEVNDNTRHKSFIGEYIPIRYPMFSVKLLLLLSSSFIFLGHNDRLRIILLVISAVLNGILLKKKSLVLVKFLLLSTCVLLIIWCLVVHPNGGPLTLDSCISTLLSNQLHYALVRLWGLFAVGQLFAGCSSQYEILVFLRRVHANYNISVFVILVGNAFAYFIQLYHQIAEGFRMRCHIRNPISRIFYILTSLMLNALALVYGCKIMDMLYENRIRNSILRTGLKNDHSLPVSLHFHFSNVVYPEQGQAVIQDATLHAELGDIILFTGANGSGKTTLLNLITGVIPNVLNASYEGSVKDSEQLQGHIGMVFQSVENELFFDTPESQLCHLHPEIRDYWLQKFSLVYKEIKNRSVMDFSSGEQQRLSLIAELLDETHTICLLDEPTAFLDTEGIAVFGELLQHVSSHKIVIIVSHDPFCKRYANRFITIRDGRLSEGCWYNAYEYCPIPVSLENACYTIHIPIAQPKSELSFRKGEIVGIVGPNGCGKTTLGRQIFDSFYKEYPDVVCSMMLQRNDYQLFDTSVSRELLLGLKDDDAAHKKAQIYLERLGLDAFLDHPAQFLSGGQKRALVILSLLMQNPEVVILDEPFSSLDSGHAKAILDVLVDYYKRTHALIIICDQEHSSLLKLCSRIINP